MSRLKIALALAVGTVLALPSAAPAATVSAAADSFCWTVPKAPTYSASGQIVYEGGVQCEGNVQELSVKVSLSMNGSFVTHTSKTCESTSRCFDLGLYPNRSGNQEWCTWVYAQHLISTEACETAGF